MKELANKNCFITGAANGIGSAFALGLANEGMNLYLTDIDMENLAKVKQDVEEIGVNVYTGKCDVSKIGDFERAKDEFYSKFDQLDLLINNAGIVIGGSFLEITLEDWKEVLDINLWSIIHSLNAFLPKMLEQRQGHIVNVASAAGLVGLSEPLPYVTSKFAVVGLSEALFSQLSTYGINVSVVTPLYVRTTIFDKAKVKLSEEMVKDVGREKCEEISRDLLRNMKSKATRPERAVRKYIKGIKEERLYIYDSPAALALLTLKGRDPQQFEKFLKLSMAQAVKQQREHFKKFGVDIEKYM